MNKSAIRSFIRNISRYVYSDAQLTILGKSGYIRWTLRRVPGQVIFEDENGIDPDYSERIMDVVKTGGYASAILRSITSETEIKTGGSFMEIRGYFIYINAGVISWNGLSAEDVFDAVNHDFKTGRKLKPDAREIYCGLDGECLDYSKKSVVLVKRKIKAKKLHY
ncbi:TVG1191381 [Thermoplasma volcanium GSS1]|uniref:TVG1191381 protein n=1 Tax=Thermoplasma volcanium (strain ATCC 51530 / DSM 4299 / JCM 9571 / NBRC 15438 / GSS1) TaxID=273116 RepID=Q979J6_THEVO|nr:hypothetical protein [Thermoplasma volcanium]BAB60307.1 TVG1191381 [Thermoplasma volcanium GSS1]